MQSTRSLRLSRSMWFALMVSVVLALTSIPAFAGRGGNPNKGGGKTPTPTATIVAHCPCIAGDTITFTGSGFDGVQGTASLDMGGAYTSVAVAADGTLSFEWPFFQQPAAYEVNVYQHRTRNKMELKASTTVDVVAP